MTAVDRAKGRRLARSETPTRAELKVFLSYSRADRAKTERLFSELRARGFAPFIDVEDISPGEPWRERLAKLIAAADTVLFLISPTAIASEHVAWEVNEAERRQKRLFPLVIEDTPPEAAPHRLERLNFIFLRSEDEWSKNIGTLEQGLLVDFRWVREHTLYAEAAARWIESGRQARRLLSGPDIAAAEAWRDSQPAQGLKPTAEQLEYIGASRRMAISSARRLTIAAIVGLGLFATLAVIANEARVSAGLAALRAQLVADASRLMDAAGRRDGGAALADAVWDYSVAERELGDVPFPVWNALRLAHEKSRLLARRRSEIEPVDFERRADGGLTLTTVEGELVVLDAAFGQERRLSPAYEGQELAPRERIAFTTSRRAVAAREDGATRFVDLKGSVLFEDRAFLSDSPQAIDAGDNCVVRSADGRVVIDAVSLTRAPRELQTLKKTGIGIPKVIRANAACDAVLVVGAAGDALWAWLDSKGGWMSRTLDGEPGDLWSVSPDLSIVAAHTGGDEVYVWGDRSAGWKVASLYDETQQTPGSIEELRITADRRFLVEFFRSSAVYDLDGALLVQPEQLVSVSFSSYFDDDELLVVWDRTSLSYSYYDARPVRGARPLIADVDLPDRQTVSLLGRCGGDRLYVADSEGTVASYDWASDDSPPRFLRLGKVASLVRRIDCGPAADAAVSDDQVLSLTEGGAVRPIEATSFMTGAQSFSLANNRRIRRLLGTVDLIDAQGSTLDQVDMDELGLDDLREIVFDAATQEAIALGAMHTNGIRFGAVRFLRATSEGRLVIAAAVDFPDFDFVSYGVSLGEGRYAFVGLPGTLALYNRRSQTFRQVALGITGVATRVQPINPDLFAVASMEADVQLWTWQGARLEPSPAAGVGAYGLALVAAGRRQEDIIFSHGDRQVLQLVLSGPGLMRLACEQLSRLQEQPVARIKGCTASAPVSPWLRRFTPVYSLAGPQQAG